MSSIIGRAIIVSAPPFKADKILNNNTWKIIKEVSDKNQGQNYWAVGDCKEITMNGKVSDGLTLTNYSAWVFIIGFNHNAEREGNGITFQGFKATDKGTDVCLADSSYLTPRTKGTWFNMNNSGANSGGWEASLMRKNVMPLIKAAFPSDLQAIIKTSTIYTDNAGGKPQTLPELTATQDDVFLLAEYEVFGTRSFANSKEANYLKQYVYYAAGNSKLKYTHNATSDTAFWWERSPLSGYLYNFCGVLIDGTAANGYADSCYCVSPAFKV